MTTKWETEVSQLKVATKSPLIDKNTQILHMIPNESAFIKNLKKEINLLYANTPIGVGGWFFNFTLFRSKIGLGDEDFQGNINL